MAFEKRGTGAQEQAENPEIKAEAEAVDQKAEKVAEQIDNADLNKLNSVEFEKLDSKIDAIISALVVLGGFAATAAAVIAEGHGLGGLSPAEAAGYGGAGLAGGIAGLAGLQKLFYSAGRFFRASEKMRAEAK